MTKMRKQIIIGMGLLLGVVGIAVLLRVAGIIPFRAPGGPERVTRCTQQSAEKAEAEFQEKIAKLFEERGQEAIVRHPSSADVIRRALHCKFLPLALDFQQSPHDPIRPYPDDYTPSLCDKGTIDRLPSIIKNNQDEIIRAAASVGRLHIRMKNGSYVFWGTASLVAPDVVATTCHTLNSYIHKNGDQLELEPQTSDQCPERSKISV